MFMTSHQPHLNHDRLIAKLQHFADGLNQKRLEKEALSISLGKCDLQSDLRGEILVYEEILESYYDQFEEILTR